jgi:DNA-binding transcriptional ArsR family regulator
VFLDHRGPTTPNALAKLAGRSVQTVSGHLAKLRAADMVRYDTVGKEVRYWLKRRGETRALLRSLEKVVHASGKLG